jgi:hypothetical protein
VQLAPASTVVHRGAGTAPASSEGILLAGDLCCHASRESIVLAGHISHSPTQMVPFVLAGGLYRPTCTQSLENLIFSNGFKWRNSQLESCRYWEVIKLCSLQPFYFKSYCQWNSNLNLSNLIFKFYKWPQMEKLSTRKRSQKVMSLYSWHVFNLNPFSLKKWFTLGIV